jgi:RNA polymerase sigma-70 factor (ECF subfamily)
MPEMNRATDDEARRAIELVARESYGRLVAFLAKGSRDVSAAEDALGEAFRSALVNWPATGVPVNPEAWLLTAARRRRTDAARRQKTRDAATPLLARESKTSELGATDVIPDERMALLFALAHPAIEATLHTPLMLQTVLGLEAGEVASAFAVSPVAMAQRLVRAKTKIRDAGIRFDVPGPDELAPRLGAVLSAVYAAYTCGHDTSRPIDGEMRQGSRPRRSTSPAYLLD